MLRLLFCLENVNWIHDDYCKNQDKSLLQEKIKPNYIIIISKPQNKGERQKKNLEQSNKDRTVKSTK